jgi:hypothetical protein
MEWGLLVYMWGPAAAQVPRIERSSSWADDRHPAHEAVQLCFWCSAVPSLISCLLLAHHQLNPFQLAKKRLYPFQVSIFSSARWQKAIYTYAYKSNSIIYTQSQLGTTYFSIYNTYGLYWLQQRVKSAFQELKRHILNEFLWWTNILKFFGVHRIGYLLQRQRHAVAGNKLRRNILQGTPPQKIK